MSEKELSAHQKIFVQQAEAAELEVDYSYSGRGMYGETCPCVRIERLYQFPDHDLYCTDRMGMGYVVYCKR